MCWVACSDLEALVDAGDIVGVHGGVKRISTHHTAHFWQSSISCDVLGGRAAT